MKILVFQWTDILNLGSTFERCITCFCNNEVWESTRTIT